MVVLSAKAQWSNGNKDEKHEAHTPRGSFLIPGTRFRVLLWLVGCSEACLAGWLWCKVELSMWPGMVSVNSKFPSRFTRAEGKLIENVPSDVGAVLRMDVVQHSPEVIN